MNRRGLLLAAVAMLAMVGCSEQTKPPANPTLTVFNVRPEPVAVGASGIAAVQVACGAEIQLHPKGPLPWTVTVQSAGGTQTATATVNTSVVVTGVDASGHDSVTVHLPNNGPQPRCPGR